MIQSSKTSIQFVGQPGAGAAVGFSSGASVLTNLSSAPRIPGFAFFGTDGDGLIIQRTEHDTSISYQTKTTIDGLGSNFIAGIFVDSDATIWAGTYHPSDVNQGGLSVSRDFGQTWETFRVNGLYDELGRNRSPLSSGMKTNNIRTITRDRLTSKLIIATDDGVMFATVIPANVLTLTATQTQAVNDQIFFSVSTTLNGLGSNNVHTVAVEEQTVPTVLPTEPTIRTTWWAGTDLGLSRSTDQGATWKTFNLAAAPLDLEGPALTFVAPENNSIIANIINIQVQASDISSIKSVEISFDNQNFASIALNPISNNYETMFDTRTLTNGKVFLYARATDGLGNVSNAVPLILTVVNAVPAHLFSIEIVDPQNNATISGIFPVRLRVVSSVGVKSVQVSDDPGPEPSAYYPYPPYDPVASPFADATPVITPRTLSSTLQIIAAPTLLPGSLTVFEYLYEYKLDTTSIPTGDAVALTAIAIAEDGITTAQATSHFTVYNRLPNVQAVSVVGHTIWTGTTHQCGLTLSQDNGKTWQLFNTTNSNISSDNIQAIAVRKNEVWVGTDNGLNLSTDMGRTWRVFTDVQDRLPNPDIRAIAFQGSAVWVGTVNGVGKLAQVGLPFTVCKSPDLSGNQINHIFVDCDQTCVWLSTNNGISLTKNGGTNWIKFNKLANGLPENMVNAITRYSGKIYAATTNGLGISGNEGQTFVRIAAPPIGDNIVICLKPDGSDLWIGTFNGLTKLNAQGQFTTFRREGIFSGGIGNQFIQLSQANIGLKSNVINSVAQ